MIVDEAAGEAFFEKTYITEGMQDLVSEGLTRLAGASSQAIFHLKQSMGGGKTHLMLGFGYLARHPGLRSKYCAGMPYAFDFEQADIATFNGRNNPDNFFWGEIANQLGKSDQFKGFWTSGPKAPDERDWLNLFEGDRPVLILLDELPPYFHYLDLQKVGNGSVADIATRAFANLLTAAGKKKNVCIVVSDLAAAYDTGGNLINRALADARSELGRQERNITPVDLAANEIYDILRKRLFKALPDQAEIEDIADAFGRKLAEAAKSKTASRGAEAIADEIAVTYPFHPRLKNVIALFQENEQFEKTRGLLELVSRLLKSVWERDSNDVFLIGPQHFDLSIGDVRDKLTEISGMRDVIATDLWDAQHSAHAQDAPQPLVDDMIRQRLQEMFRPSRKTCYGEVLPLPKLEDVADRVRRGRVLLVVSPDSAIPPEVLQGFFDSISQKNNLCVLAWAAETADADQVRVICSKWAALRPEERWWLFAMTVAEAGLPDDTQRGWRRALFYALSDGEKPPSKRKRPRPQEHDIL